MMVLIDKILQKRYLLIQVLDLLKKFFLVLLVLWVQALAKYWKSDLIFTQSVDT